MAASQVMGTGEPQWPRVKRLIHAERRFPRRRDRERWNIMSMIMVEILWHRRENRRKQRKQTSTVTTHPLTEKIQRITPHLLSSLGRDKSPSFSWQLPAWARTLGRMKEYRRGSHSIFQLHIHMVWCTKYRKKVLKD